MSGLNKKHYYLDSFGLFSIGIFSLGYVVFIKGLAERYIQFPFLDFPIFPGEILLFLCLLLFLAKYRNNPPKFTKWHYVILGYFVFVIVKALYGYWKWGPLALRHAALLYYPVFAVFSYAFFRKDFFSKRTCLALTLLILTVLALKHSEYWSLSLVILGIILIKAYPIQAIKSFIFFALLIVSPYKDFYCTSRMMIVGNFLTGLYLAGALPFVLMVKKKSKFALTILMAGVVIVGLLKFADHGAVKSIIAFKHMAEVFRANDVIIEANIDHFKMQEIKVVKLYNPDKPVRNDSPSNAASGDQKVLAQRQMKEEVKPVIVHSVQEKIEEKPKPSAEPIKTEVPQVQGQTQKKDIEEKPKPLAERIKAEVVQVQDKTRKNDVEEVKTKIRQILRAPEVKTISEEKPPDALAIDDVKRAMQTALTRIYPQITDGKSGWPKGNVSNETYVQEGGTEPALPSENSRTTSKSHPKISENLSFPNVPPGRDPAKAVTSVGNPYKDVTVPPTTTNGSPRNEGKTFGGDSSETISKELKWDAPVVSVDKKDTGWVPNNNAVFRLFIWRDMLADLAKEKPVFLGFDFGKPFRSKSLEIINWGLGDWSRDGWIGAHNSYLEIIYRTGIVGILLILSLWIILFKMIRKFILTKSFTGVLLCGIIINWFAAANFLLIFELPYTAIPIWTIYGMTFAYCYKTQEEKL